jgi:hypothetical protein
LRKYFSPKTIAELEEDKVKAFEEIGALISSPDKPFHEQNLIFLLVDRPIQHERFGKKEPVENAHRIRHQLQNHVFH